MMERMDIGWEEEYVVTSEVERGRFGQEGVVAHKWWDSSGAGILGLADWPSAKWLAGERWLGQTLKRRRQLPRFNAALESAQLIFAKQGKETARLYKNSFERVVLQSRPMHYATRNRHFTLGLAAWLPSESGAYSRCVNLANCVPHFKV